MESISSSVRDQADPPFQGHQAHEFVPRVHPATHRSEPVEDRHRRRIGQEVRKRHAAPVAFEFEPPAIGRRGFDEPGGEIGSRAAEGGAGRIPSTISKCMATPHSSAASSARARMLSSTRSRSARVR